MFMNFLDELASEQEQTTRFWDWSVSVSGSKINFPAFPALRVYDVIIKED